MAAPTSNGIGIKLMIAGYAIPAIIFKEEKKNLLCTVILACPHKRCLTFTLRLLCDHLTNPTITLAVRRIHP